MPEDLQTLRRDLEANNGMPGLEILRPDDVEAAVRNFLRDGFVVVRDVLATDQVRDLRRGCEREAEALVAEFPNGAGNRGPYRYSWGGASVTGSLLHREEWVRLVDLPTLTPILTAIFGSADYHVRRAGGDFCLPGAVEYQRLHADIGDRAGGFVDPRGLAPPRRLAGSASGPSPHRPITLSDIAAGAPKSDRLLVSIRDLPCPIVCCNFLAQDFTKINGPTRQIPGTQNSREKIPELDDEPLWMKYSTVCPAPAGSALIRDIRAWHGGTPNLSNEMRAIPNAAFLAPWFRERSVPSMPREMFDLLSEHGRKVCESVVTDAHLKTGYTLNPAWKQKSEWGKS